MADKNSNINENENIKSQEDYNLKQIIEKRQNRNIMRFLMYAAATLSFISFLTTADGMITVVGEDKRWQAYFISFGIQAIVLVMGTRFFGVLEVVRKSNIKYAKTQKNGIVNIIVCILMVFLYILSILFSSFFSFVFLANHAYYEIKPSDYNIEIEQFLVSETKNLRDINDAMGRIMLGEIQGYASNFNSLISKFNTTASDDLNKIISEANLTKNLTDSISQDKLFNAQVIIDRYVPNDAQVQMIREYEGKINTINSGYQTSYQTYSVLFDELQSLSDVNLAEQRISRIDSEIKTLNDYINSLNNINDTLGWLNVTLQQAKASIKIELDTLIKSYNDIKFVYEQINMADLTIGANISLQKLYETIYSTEDISEEDVDNAIADLKIIITEYIKTSENIEDEVVQSVSACIIYLGEFKKYQELDNGLNNFEKNALNRVYIINLNNELSSEETVDSDLIITQGENMYEYVSKLYDNTDSEDKLSFDYVTYDEWKKIRREDVAQFIRLLKALPDVKMLVQLIENTYSVPANELSELQSYNEYVSTTLTEAYNLNRNRLESINDVERACRFIISEYKFMAIFCAVIAFFMDFASFLIGIFLFYSEKGYKGINETFISSK